MLKYYTRACNFYYGDHSTLMVNKKLALPLNGNDNISIVSKDSSLFPCNGNANFFLTISNDVLP